MPETYTLISVQRRDAGSERDAVSVRWDIGARAGPEVGLDGMCLEQATMGSGGEGLEVGELESRGEAEQRGWFYRLGYQLGTCRGKVAF